jgi:phage shock protein C
MIKRSTTNSYIGGVCGGIAKATDTSAIAWRLIFILAPYSFWVYVVMWVLFKQDDETNKNNHI